MLQRIFTTTKQLSVEYNGCNYNLEDDCPDFAVDLYLFIKSTCEIPLDFDI